MENPCFDNAYPNNSKQSPTPLAKTWPVRISSGLNQNRRPEIEHEQYYKTPRSVIHTSSCTLQPNLIVHRSQPLNLDLNSKDPMIALRPTPCLEDDTATRDTQFTHPLKLSLRLRRACSPQLSDVLALSVREASRAERRASSTNCDERNQDLLFACQITKVVIASSSVLVHESSR